MPDLADLRQDYRFAELTEAEAGPDPVALFLKWFQAALDAGLPEAERLHPGDQYARRPTVGPNRLTQGL